MAVRGGRGAGLRRAALGRPGLVALLVALYLGAGLLATAPQLGHVGSRFLAEATPVPGEAAAGDHLQAEYHLWLVGDQLERGRAPWRDPYTFRPESPPRWNFGGWPFGLPFWPLHALFGPVLGWNLFLLLTYLAAGAFAYLWLRELGLPLGAASVGGLVFALEPYRVAQSAGHLRGPISALLPLALWAFERSRHGSRWWLAATAAALASIPFSDVHLSLGAIPFFLLYALCRSRDRVRLAGAAAATGIAVASALVVGSFAVSGSIGSGGRSLREVAHYSASGLDFVTRHPRHGLESFVFLGWLTPLLALVGLVLLVRARRYGLAVALAVGAVVPMLLALGTHFPLYSTLWHHFAPVRYPRVPERQMPVACLALAGLTAFAVARLRVGLAVAGIVLILAADLHVTGIYDAAAADRGNRAYAALRNEPPGRLLEVPVLDPSVQLGSIYLWYDQEARRERPGGYSTIAPKAAARLALRLQELNCGDWRPGTDELLRRLGVRYVAFHRGLAGPTSWFAWRELRRHGFGQLERDGAIWMLARGRAGATSPVAEPTRAIVFCEGWNERSPRYRHAVFWARGPVRVTLTTRDPVRTKITVDRRPVRSLQVSGPVSLRVRTGPGWHDIGVDVDRADRGLRVEVAP
jgi:glycosyl transferase family 87